VGLENNMVVYATVKVDGKAVEAPGSLLAAFDGESIAGVATIEDGPVSKYYRLHIWSNNSTKEGLVLKSYNSETGKIYSLSPSIKFESDAVEGIINEPLLFTGSTPLPEPTPSPTPEPTPSPTPTQTVLTPSSAPAPSGGGGSGGGGQSEPAKKSKGSKKSSASKSAKSKTSGNSAKKSSATSAKKSGAKKAKKK
jgi:hypothetical protein